MTLFVAGVSHKTAPVEVREQLAVTPSHLVDAAEVLKLFGHLDEVVLLSTCNRVALYGTTPQAPGDIKALLQMLSATPRDLERHTYVYEGAAAGCRRAQSTAGFDGSAGG